MGGSPRWSPPALFLECQPSRSIFGPVDYRVDIRGGLAPGNELFQAPLQDGSVEQHPVVALQTPKPDVRAKPNDSPIKTATWVRLPQPHHIT